MANLANWALGTISNWFRPRQVGGVWFYGLSDYSAFKELEYLNSFNEIPELNAIINYKARAFSAGVIRALDSKGNEIENDPIVTLLKKPNWFQSEKEFLRQTKLFHEIFGNEYVYSFFGVGSKPIKTKAIYTLPPNLVRCEYESEKPFFLNDDQTKYPDGVKYTYTLDKDKDLPIEQIIHLNDNRVSITDRDRKSMLCGESKMKGLTVAINNIKMAYETRGQILADRGALGILSNKSADIAGQIPVSAEDRDEVHKQYSGIYGGLKGQKRVIITNADLRWQEMSVSPDKLGLFKETEEDFYKMCDAYGTPCELFASSKGATYVNKNEARKDLYDNTTIPEANEWIGALSNYYYPDGNVTLVMDYSHLSIFQEDLELNAAALGNLVKGLSQAFADGAITVQEYQFELNKIGLAVGNKPQ